MLRTGPRIPRERTTLSAMTVGACWLCRRVGVAPTPSLDVELLSKLCDEVSRINTVRRRRHLAVELACEGGDVAELFAGRWLAAFGADAGPGAGALAVPLLVVALV